MTTTLPPAPPAPGRTRPSGSAPLLLLLLFATLLIAIVGGWTFKTLRDDIRASAQRTLTIIAEQKKQEIDHWLSQARTDAGLFFSEASSVTADFRQWRESGERDRALLAQLTGRLQFLAQIREWDGVALFDPAGRPVFSQGVAVGTEPGVERIRQALAGQEPLLIDLHFDRRGHVVFGMLAPIRSSGPESLGVACLLWRAFIRWSRNGRCRPGRPRPTW